MLCPSCGTMINDDAATCEYCGHEFKKKRTRTRKALPSTNTETGTLNALQKALTAARKMEAARDKEDSFVQRRQEIAKKRQEIIDDDMPDGLVGIGLLSVLIAGGFGYSQAEGVGLIGAVVITIIVVFIIYAAYSSLTKDRREAEADTYYNSCMKALEKEEKAHRKAVAARQKNSDTMEALKFLPEKYRSSETISSLIQLFREKRVDNLKEALNLYEDGAYKRRMEEMQQKQMEELNTRMQCPNCGGRNCTLMTETTTKKSSYSASDGCCGFILFGPIGLLCGACGMGEESKTKSYWVCQSCGNKFNV